jgi:type VI secretion system protein ImpK
VNAAQLSRSVLLNKLRDFYALIVKLKAEIGLLGAEVTVDRVQGELRAFMDDQLRALGDSPDEVGYHLYDALRYVMVASADDAFLHLKHDWPGRARWLSNTLEKQIFGTQRAGASFFDRIDELLASRDKSKEEVATAYLIALLLGFKGRFRGQEEEELVSYRERLLYFVGLGQTGGLDAAKPLFPDAYAHTINKDPTEKLPDHRMYKILLVLVIIGYFVGAHFLWHFETDEVRTVVGEMKQLKD